MKIKYKRPFDWEPIKTIAGSIIIFMGMYALLVIGNCL